MNAQKTYNQLSAEESQIIINKGTEAPYSGEYYYHNEEGTYLCKQCDAPLYKSSDKFDAQCGWPSFDDEIEGAVVRKTDKDGHRTEILCANCGGHLGHVFEGEGFTKKDTRHCVNSLSLSFKPLEFLKVNTIDTAIFAGGCFWGMQYYFENQKGVKSTEVGYIGGHIENPTYEDVCSHKSGHIEALQVVFDSTMVSFEALAKLFFEIHDPGQVNRQGPDIGEQYKSAVFYRTQEQKQISEKLISELKSLNYSVATELIKATTFWKAENYHQHYYSKKSGSPYCHFYQKKFK
jgi:peptide methionine sulfoxide reductase msrA/msrB